MVCNWGDFDFACQICFDSGKTSSHKRQELARSNASI
jgi:hypothetical protein